MTMMMMVVVVVVVAGLGGACGLIMGHWARSA